MILLDTHVLLWLRAGDERLGHSAKRQIDQAWADDALAVSAISFWEIAMLGRKNRIRLPKNPQHWRRELLEQGLVEIPVTGAIGLRAAALEGFHADPADRIIVATALEGHQLVTADERILGWDGPLDRLAAGG